ncbi:sporulation initiation phosphotransferase B [Neobacillus dielmonensis]|uniref:sporulation initiation phosphotransferase B n=1 Tax=Neobacillus dielmonensis TaxID=1347369 RepID=UPI0005A86652|nr:sporulation initiation phosphotransferase B [Neobacillus dielmonensis]
MEKQWDIIEVLRHSRHDWLNKLQLIKGNLDLNRIDRVKEVIDQIVIEAQHETKLSNLGVPHFAALLLRTNWESRSFLLEYEVFEDGDSGKINDSALADWSNLFFSCLDQAVDVYQENHLSVTIDPQSEGIRFFFDFSGIIRNSELIEKFLAAPKESDMDFSIKEFSENELALEVFMPVM